MSRGEPYVNGRNRETLLMSVLLTLKRQGKKRTILIHLCMMKTMAAGLKACMR